VGKLAELILGWYALHARKLPWRDLPDPYAVWVSEIMLQQTRVETVIPYYEKWMKSFPGIPELANSTEAEVLAAWEGLGYYGRARNLHRASQFVMKSYMDIPGIGRYTAGAIASMAFHKDEPTLDGNIRRIFSRIFDIQEPVNTTSTEKRLWLMVGAELPAGRAGDFNQALMDLGATVCLPKNPKCQQCPIISLCLAWEKGVQSERPILKAKPKQPLYIYVAAIIRCADSYLLVKRPSHGLLGGMWEFPNERVVHGGSSFEKEVASLMQDKFGLRVDIFSQLGIFKHAYTHFRLILHAFNCQLEDGNLVKSPLTWVPYERLSDFPMGKVARQISKTLEQDERL
jgi:A/G-specific adenine glycosylase